MGYDGGGEGITLYLNLPHPITTTIITKVRRDYRSRRVVRNFVIIFSEKTIWFKLWKELCYENHSENCCNLPKIILHMAKVQILLHSEHYCYTGNFLVNSPYGYFRPYGSASWYLIYSLLSYSVSRGFYRCLAALRAASFFAQPLHPPTISPVCLFAWILYPPSKVMNQFHRS